MPPRLASDPPTPLRLALERLGINQTALARALGCERQQVHTWVLGEYTPAPARRRQIASVIDIAEDELWPDLSLDSDETGSRAA